MHAYLYGAGKGSMCGRQRTGSWLSPTMCVSGIELRLVCFRSKGLYWLIYFGSQDTEVLNIHKH